MNELKQGFNERVDFLEKKIEINRSKIVFFEEKIGRLDEMNSKMMKEIAYLHKRLIEGSPLKEGKAK